MSDWLKEFANRFYLNFIKDERWRYITRGLRTTVLITVFALILGLYRCNNPFRPRQDGQA